MAASILTPITLITTTLAIAAASSSPSPNNALNNAAAAAAAAEATTGTIITDPSTSAITFAAATPSTCDCTQLRYAVIALSTILGTLVLSVVVFVVVKAKRWTRKGAMARDGEVKELKRERDDAERRERGRDRGRESGSGW